MKKTLRPPLARKPKLRQIIFLQEKPSSFWRIKEFEILYQKVIRLFLPTCKKSIELNLVSSKSIQKLNSQFRGKNKATDVLSFPSSSRESPLLGSVVIDLQTSRRQAKEFGHSLRQEVLELFTHGVLHLIGYDHIQKKDALQMKQAEEKVFRWLQRQKKES